MTCSGFSFAGAGRLAKGDIIKMTRHEIVEERWAAVEYEKFGQFAFWSPETVFQKQAAAANLAAVATAATVEMDAVAPVEQYEAVAPELDREFAAL